MFKQVLEITLMNLRNLPTRLGTSSVIVVGIAGVVAVLIGILALGNGFRTALVSAAQPDRAIVVRDGSTNEMNSGMSYEHMNIVAEMPGVGLVSGETYAVADIPKKSTGLDANVVMRGVTPAAFEIRPEITMVEGRHFEPGKGEIVVGTGARDIFAGLELGDVLDFRGATWEVVGVFDAGGAAYQGEIWMDQASMQSAFRRGGGVSSLRVRLEPGEAGDPANIQALIEADPRIELKITSEKEFYSAQSDQMTGIITGFGYTIATIMAIGAIFAALNTMYSAVSERTVEIATLRALGFGGTPVVISVMIEAICLALLGGLIGGALVYFVADGYTSSTLNTTTFSQVTFDTNVSMQLLTLGITWALVLGIIGGLFPAVRAARLPIISALRGE